MINTSNEDIWLKPGTRLARVQAIDEICSGAGEIDVTVSCNGITVEKNNSLELRDKNPELPDLSTLQYDKSQKDKIEKLLQHHKEVFVSEGSPLGCTDTVRHHIRTTDDVPISQPYRRIPPQLFEEVRNHLNDLLKKGVIQESESAYAAPTVLVRKKTGELRICNDYRKLNKKVVRDVFPLPRIEESWEAMAGVKIFSTLDLASAYNQIQVEPADRPKTAITTPFGLFEAVRMPFGFANAPATFQRLMVKIFREDIFRVLLVYLDYLIIYSGSFEEHLETLNMVFSKLKEHGLVLKGPKCQLFKKDVKYLGHVLSCDGVRTDPDKIIAVEKWCKPETLQELRRFIGFASYYRRFVPSFAQKAAPLHALVGQLVEKKKGKKVKVGDLWKDDHDIAFSALKEALTSTPVLCYPDFSKGFILEIDASAAGLGAILSQEQKGQRRVVAYASRGLRPNERKSDTFSSMQLETLALVWAVGDKFKDYLHQPFTVITDNNPLSYFMSKEKLSAKEQKWAAMLARYEFTIEYRSGHKNVAADALSRQERRPWDTSGSSPSETCALLVGTTKVSPELQAHILDGVQRPVVVKCNKLNMALVFHQNTMCFTRYNFGWISRITRQRSSSRYYKKVYHSSNKVTKD